MMDHQTDTELTDAELIETVRSGNKQAFGILIERYQSMTRRVALGLVSDPEVAYELAQESLLQAYLSLGSLRRTERFQSWLHGIVRNVCGSYLRTQKMHLYPLDDVLPELGEEHSLSPYIAPDPHDKLEAAELHERVMEAISSLSAKNRETTLLFYYEQLSVSEIAEAVDASVNAVKSRLFQARKQLRTQLASVYTPMYGPVHRTAPETLYVNGENLVNERNTKMVKITDIHAFQALHSEQHYHYVLHLLDSTGNRTLPLWIGISEGDFISQHLNGETTTRPLTQHYAASILDALGATLQEVRIETLRDITFFAVVKLQQGDSIYELDARPSDAIASALLAKAPIFVTDEIMEQFSHELPQPFDKASWVEKVKADLASRMELQAWATNLIKESGLFTQRARQVWTQMTEEAVELRHGYIGTEHLLLSLVRDSDGIAVKILNELEVGLAQVTEAISRLVGQGENRPTGEPVFAPRLAQVCKLDIIRIK